MPPVGSSDDDLDGGGVGRTPLAVCRDVGRCSVRVSSPATGGRGGGAGADGAPTAVSGGVGAAGAGGGLPAAGDDGDGFV